MELRIKEYVENVIDMYLSKDDTKLIFSDENYALRLNLEGFGSVYSDNVLLRDYYTEDELEDIYEYILHNGVDVSCGEDVTDMFVHGYDPDGRDSLCDGDITYL